VDLNLRVRKLKCCVICFESLLSEMPIRVRNMEFIGVALMDNTLKQIFGLCQWFSALRGDDNRFCFRLVCRLLLVNGESRQLTCIAQIMQNHRHHCSDIIRESQKNSTEV
jgi:hypothetical protein